MLQATETNAAQAEADRLMTICNACRYCEGLCAVFPAMELRRVFAGGDVDYLANLCHGCGACFYDCQYAPPHEFAVNVPSTFATLREDTYQRYVWPAQFSGLFARNGLWIALSAAFGVSAFLIGFAAWHRPGVLFAVHTGPGAFYRLMPHNAMAGLFGAAFLYALLALAMGLRRYWIGTGGVGRVGRRSLWQAAFDAGRLRYLDGGGAGCMYEGEKPDDRRRVLHHLTFYGFGLCFASTVAGALFHYVFGWQAPYPVSSPVVVLGILGGVGLLVGPMGLWFADRRAANELKSPVRTGMDTAFLAMLFSTGLTGVLLLLLRATPLMGVLLAVHLGVVFALFVTLPYGKFVHGLYRFAALVRYAAESGPH